MNLTEEARVFLDEHRIGHLATADREAAPHVIPICFARLDERLYFVADEKPKRHGPRRLKRLANIAQNPHVALIVDDYREDWTKLAFLLLHLDAAIIEAVEEYEAALAALRRKYPRYRIMKLLPTTNPIVGMTVRRWHLWRASDAPAGP
jgi:PPOX class probable F420-dependent enzyme